uniref:ATP phosphoribosyltransferase n=1 Tax=Candidatus Methanomethylicus mesodigestus TaxID=1867258 RepID=A0A7C3J209_9CREN
MSEELIIAIPNKGRLKEPAVKLLAKMGILTDGSDREYLSKTTDREVNVLSVRAADIPVYVYYGIADLGITGKDIISEKGLDLYEIMDLGFGKCDLVVAVRKELPYKSPSDLPQGSRVATEFSNITKSYFDGLGIQVEIIELRGAMEIAPSLGLADAIVDLTSTGVTLERNGLKSIGKILKSSARLICNKVSYKTKYAAIERVTAKMRDA